MEWGSVLGVVIVLMGMGMLHMERRIRDLEGRVDRLNKRTAHLIEPPPSLEGSSPAPTSRPRTA